MRNRRNTTEADADRFGFRWGPMDVSRQTEHKGSHWVSVLTDHGCVDIYVSRTGRSIRVFRGSAELK